MLALDNIVVIILELFLLLFKFMFEFNSFFALFSFCLFWNFFFLLIPFWVCLSQSHGIGSMGHFHLCGTLAQAEHVEIHKNMILRCERCNLIWATRTLELIAPWKCERLYLHTHCTRLEYTCTLQSDLSWKDYWTNANILTSPVWSDWTTLFHLTTSKEKHCIEVIYKKSWDYIFKTWSALIKGIVLLDWYCQPECQFMCVVGLIELLSKMSFLKF